eukprot:1063874-Heterocapsa_arctica.AAC.1
MQSIFDAALHDADLAHKITGSEDVVLRVVAGLAGIVVLGIVNGVPRRLIVVGRRGRRWLLRRRSPGRGIPARGVYDADVLHVALEELQR